MVNSELIIHLASQEDKQTDRIQTYLLSEVEKIAFKKEIWNFRRCTINLEITLGKNIQFFCHCRAQNNYIQYEKNKQRLTSTLFLHFQIKMVERTGRASQQNTFFSFNDWKIIGSFNVRLLQIYITVFTTPFNNMRSLKFSNAIIIH